jgi:hypothetical protein
VEFVGDFSAKALVAEFRWLWFEVMEQSRIDARLGSVCAMHGADRPGNHDETVEAIERLLPCCFESGCRVDRVLDARRRGYWCAWCRSKEMRPWLTGRACGSPRRRCGVSRIVA